MKTKFNFTLFQKLYFYFSHFYYKLLIPWDCKKGRSALIIAEIIFVLNDIFKTKIKVPKRFIVSEFITKFGKFTIEKSEITNTIIVSPAYERLDKELLLSLIKKKLEQNKKVLFIDIGAHIGTYPIMVANVFRDKKKLFIYAFEPDSIEFTGKSFSLLEKNIKDNKVTNIKLFHLGLGSKNTKTPNCVGIITKRFDSVVKSSIAKQYDSIFIKIDIEGYEKEALMGAKEFLKNARNMTLLVEDYIDKRIVTYLEKEKFIFYKKLSPYNAFWIKSKETSK